MCKKIFFTALLVLLPSCGTYAAASCGTCANDVENEFESLDDEDNNDTLEVGPKVDYSSCRRRNKAEVIQNSDEDMSREILHPAFPRTTRKDLVLEDEKCIAFYDIKPQTRIHVLIIPKISCVDFDDFINKEPDFRYFFKFVAKVARKLGITEYKLRTSKGRSAGQEVMHLHFHLQAH